MHSPLQTAVGVTSVHVPAMALKTLVDFLATDKALASCSKVVTVFGQAFHQVDAFSDVLKVSKTRHCIQIGS